MRLFALVVAFALVVSVAPATAAEPVKITVPAASTALASLYVAKSAGFFAEEGLDVDVVLAAGAACIQAVLARDAQFAVAPGTYHLMSYERGQRLVALASVLNRNAINVVIHKDVARERGITEKSPLAEKIKALRGLKLSGAAVGSFSYQVLTYYLLRAGFDPHKDVQLIGVGSAPAMLAALEQHKVDGFAIGTPTPEAAVARGFGFLVVDNSAGEDLDFAEFMMDVLVASPDLLKQQPDLVRKTARALLKANAWLLDHPADQGVVHMKPFLGRLDDKIIQAGLKKVLLGIPRDGRVTERAVTLTQDFLRKVGALKTTIPFDQIASNEFVGR